MKGFISGRNRFFREASPYIIKIGDFIRSGYLSTTHTSGCFYAIIPFVDIYSLIHGKISSQNNYYSKEEILLKSPNSWIVF
ncbi:MAG: hypothetical protein Q8P44_01250 [Dehalococcoidia bacterium]|nr:hypothetical protein [Dehalococcoidia bacterium]